MFIHYGIKHRNRRPVAYSKDYCNNCEKQVYAQQWQSKAYFHVFGVPLIPLGKRLQWNCCECEKKTGARYHSGVFAKLVILSIAGYAVVMLFQPEVEQFTQSIWLLRICAIGLAGGCLIWLLRHRSRPTQKKMRTLLEPLTETHCHFCNSPLYLGIETRCDSCELEVIRRIAKRA